MVRENMPTKKILKQIAASAVAMAGAKPAKKALKRKRNRAKRKGNIPVSIPVAQSNVLTNNRPRYSVKDGNFCVKHREYITDIAGSVTFTARTFNINPGLITAFPWLANIANQYESYLFKSLHFIYEPACATTVAGSIMLAVDFDASDAAPTSKVQMMAYSNAVRSPPWEMTKYLSINSDLRKFGVQRYVRNSPVSGDIKTYDIGNFFLATSNFADNTFVGELYVEYELEFYTPQSSGTVGQAQLTIGASGAITNINSQGLYIAIGSTASSFTITAGTYMVVISNASAAAAQLTATGATLTTINAGFTNSGTPWVYKLVVGNLPALVDTTTVTNQARITITTISPLFTFP